MNILFRFWCDVNSQCVYDMLRPKLDFVFSFVDKQNKYMLSHKWSFLVNHFIYEVLDRFLPEEGKSKCWWTYIMGRTEEEWRLWYLQRKQKDWMCNRKEE